MLPRHWREWRILLFVTWFISVTPKVSSQTFYIISQIKDLADQPVPDVFFTVTDPSQKTHTGISDELGRLVIPVFYSIPSAVQLPILSQKDSIHGLTYQLASTHGQLTILNILGQSVGSWRLGPGAGEVRPPTSLASGKYFAFFETPNYKAVSPFIWFDNHVSGIGESRILKEFVPPQITLQKSTGMQFHLFGEKEGYENWSSTFNPEIEYNNTECIIRMNRLPIQIEDVPDTLWNGFDFKYYVDNDDGGCWFISDSVYFSIENGVLIQQISPLIIDRPIQVTYRDSANTEINLSFSNYYQDLSSIKKALVIVCEAMEWWGIGDPEVEILWDNFKYEVIPALSAFLNVPPDSLACRQLWEVVGDFGEPWQMSQIVESTRFYYNRFVLLSDEGANYAALMDSLAFLQQQEYSIDLEFSLHGSESVVCLSDGSFDINMFITDLNDRQIHIRSLYQTCCNGYGMIDEWNAYGIQAVSGAVGLNSVNIYSPIAFFQGWCSGLPFDEALDYAMKTDIAWTAALCDLTPYAFFLQPDQEEIEQSRQIVGGTNPKLYWGDF